MSAEGRCRVCGRRAPKEELLLDGGLCPVCERITVRLSPRHPLYPFWVKRISRLIHHGPEI